MASADRLIDIFNEAKARPAGAERERFLAEACRGTPELKEQALSLLQADEGAGDFLKRTVLSQTALVSEMPGDKIGRYKLLEQIGEGGCGVVYMADQEEPVRRRVALKVIKLGMDTKQVVARFEAERQALALMDHPNIAKVFDAGATDTGRPYFVMELVRGIKITEYCDENNLSTTERLDLFIQVCQAVQHAHQKGIIHRDLKPSNILVTQHDTVAVPKVIDFGIAKATTDQRLTNKTLFTAFEQFLGTPAYMSPEQAQMSGLDLDTRTDIYSLGVLLYELLTGCTPFDARELMESGFDAMRSTICGKEPVRPSTQLTRALTAARRNLSSPTAGRRTDAPLPAPASPGQGADACRLNHLKHLIHLLRGDLDWIVMKCLEKDRSRRYETANGLAADLRRHLANEPVIARPPSAAYRFQKAFRRNKLVFAATAIVVATLVVGLGVSTRQTFAARKAQAGERTQRMEAESAQKVAEIERERADAQARKATESQQQSRRLLYVADMNLAQQSLKLNNLGLARRLLDRHRPQQPGEEDLRGWEWRYLWQLARSSALVTLTNRPVRAFDVSFSPDGTLLAVSWSDGRMDLWDAPHLRRIRSLTDTGIPLHGHLSFSPASNLLAATSESNAVTLYDLDSGARSVLWRAPDQGEWEIFGLSFSQDGSRLVIYAGSSPEAGGAVWVVNVTSHQIESRHRQSHFGGAARLSPDNRRLYLARSDPLKSRYSIRCLDLVTHQELWETEPERDSGLTALVLSPDGRVLASSSGTEDSTIRVWDAATGRPISRLDGHTGFVWKLVFSKDGRRLISAGSDQSIRVWDASNWAGKPHVLRGHTDEVHGVAISEPAQLLASAGKDGNLMLWRVDATSAADGYQRLPEELGTAQVLTIDQSRMLLLPADRPPELIDLKHEALPVSQPELGSAANVLGWFGTNILCHWNGTNRILVRELRGEEFIPRAAITLSSAVRPTGFACNAERQRLAWTEASSSNSVYLENLTAPGRRIELRSDVPGLVPLRFSEDGNYLAARKRWDSLRVWKVETGEIVAFVGEHSHATFALGGRVLVVAVNQGNDNHEIVFHDLANPKHLPRRVAGRNQIRSLAVSPDGRMVASTSTGGQVHLYDPAKGEWIESLHGHLNAAFGIAFSPDGRRLISTFGGREAVKLWDVGTRQELLTLGGAGSFLTATRWSADGDVILTGTPWQVWRAPSWEEIKAAESKDRTQPQQP